nr:MAG TPA: hypothetical protein [Caudoviricetes sp.]
MSPSTSGGTGAGVIDATVDNTFSAVVKGDSPVVAYRIGIFKNNATSDLVYNSGVIQLSTPFYGTSPAGKTIPFTYTVPSTSGVTNGYTYGYKYILTLWWELDTTDYTTGCVQSFESVFYARSAPTLSIATISTSVSASGLPIVSSRSHTFEGQYYQSNNVGVAWFSWTLATKNNLSSPVASIGPVYSCPKIEFEYDGLMSGTDYCIKVDARTQDGIEVSSGWVDFTVSYGTVTIQSAVEVEQTPENGLLIDFGNIKYIEGAPSSNNWRFIKPCPSEGHTCVEIDSGTNIVFTSSEHFDVDIPVGGEIVTSFYLSADSSEILYASGTDDAGNDYYLRLSFSGHTDGLKPSKTLVPSKSLVPSAGIRGGFTLDVNGTKYYKAISIPLPCAWFVACIRSTGLTIYENRFTFDKSDMTIIEGATYGN